MYELPDARDRFRFRPTNPDGYVEPFPYKLVSEFEGEVIPERRWLVPDWIPQGQVTLLGGDGGVGKSLLAQQLMTSLALGGGAVRPHRLHRKGRTPSAVSLVSRANRGLARAPS